MKIINNCDKKVKTNRIKDNSVRFSIKYFVFLVFSAF